MQRYAKHLKRCLEIKRTSITRLKRLRLSPRSPLGSFLKSKEPRLRDWNMADDMGIDFWGFTWNQKNLDYEIETGPALRHLLCWGLLKSKEPRLRDWNFNKVEGKRAWDRLEIKRTSITRLKLRKLVIYVFHLFTLKSKEPRLRDWNIDIQHALLIVRCLEIKRTSITRLKPFLS